MKFKYKFDVPEAKKIRLIINTDANNEADDQYAIVHALLTPRFKIKGIIAAHYGTERHDQSMQRSYDEVLKVLDLMEIDEMNVVKGAAYALPDVHTAQPSEGSKLIIEEAMKDDANPLFVVFLGPITDLASAYLEEPKIAGRLTAVWIGGGAYPNGNSEFNLSNDIHAANVVFSSKLDIWQVPKPVYSMVRVSIAELQYKIQPYGKIGNYLFEQLVALNDSYSSPGRWPLGESWSLGDSPVVSLLIDPHMFHYDMIPAPFITEDMYYVQQDKNRPIRVYNYVDSRYTLEDMFAKLAIHFPKSDEI